MGGITRYKQNFTNIRSQFLNGTAKIDTSIMDQNNIIAITTDSILKIN
ncbi:MAG: hypothetical protein ACKVOM_00315 [Ferruginibacter sp.]